MVAPTAMVGFYTILLVVLVAAFCFATIYLNRRTFLLLSALPLFIYGVGFYTFPGYMLTLSVVSGTTGPEHLVAYSHQGKAFLGTVALFYFCGSTDDDRVTAWLLTQVAQTCLAQVVALLSFHYSQDYKLQHDERPAILLNTDVNKVLYIGMGLWFLLTLIQFLRKPQLQLKSSTQYDIRMSIHRAILSYSTFYVSLLMIANADIIRTSYAASMKEQPPMDDVERFAYQLAGAFFLTQSWAIKNSEDFSRPRDQASVFKAHLLLICLGVLSMTEHTFTGKITLQDCLPTAILRLILAVNSILAIRRASEVEKELNEYCRSSVKKTS